MYDALVFRAAKIILERHGDRAAAVAREQQQDRLAKTDAQGYATWGDVAAAIRELQRTERRVGERIQ